MIVLAKTSAPTISVRRCSSPQVVCNRFLSPVKVARNSAAIAVHRYSASFATVRLPRFPETQAGLMGADGSFLMGADGTILQGADV